MLPLSGAVKIYCCRTPINLHKSFDGLPGIVQQYFNADPTSGHLFVFFNRTFKMVKIIYWDSDGYAIWSKRLVQGRFNFPHSSDGKIIIDQRDLFSILSGIKPHRYYKRFSLNNH